MKVTIHLRSTSQSLACLKHYVTLKPRNRRRLSAISESNNYSPVLSHFIRLYCEREDRYIASDFPLTKTMK